MNLLSKLIADVGQFFRASDDDHAACDAGCAACLHMLPFPAIVSNQDSSDRREMSLAAGIVSAAASWFPWLIGWVVRPEERPSSEIGPSARGPLPSIIGHRAT